MNSKQIDIAEEYGPLLHTALRKLCDSSPTTYAWNAIHLVPKTWGRFARFVGEEKPTNGETLHEAYEAWMKSVRLEDRREGDPFYAAQIFEYALRQFDLEDWDGFAGYLDQVDA